MGVVRGKELMETVGFGRDGICMLGKGGNVGLGRLGIAGSGGNVLGSGGMAGSVDACGEPEVWSSCLAARLILMLESDKAMIRERAKQW
ncbi:unnamed protein product [Ilex paraguariensis]|uniref:Uncharacterized protein n=1 Tax=Ilex paraguariensis TaxID=185542 RepID=A0ABC8SLJ4_9AQUA